MHSLSLQIKTLNCATQPHTVHKNAGASELIIVNALGETVPHSTTGEKHVSLAGFPPGSYGIVVRTGGNILSIPHYVSR